MNTLNQPPTVPQLKELDDLYYTAPLAVYEAALQSAVKCLQQTFPDLTIAFAEIFTFVAGSHRQAHGGMCHVLMPIERSTQ